MTDLIDFGRLLALILFCIIMAPVALLFAYADMVREQDERKL